MLATLATNGWPEDFPATILSLQSGNKIDKWRLIGSFGQGGASSLSFADYAVIVSRHRDNPRVVGFTVVRVLHLSERYKRGLLRLPLSEGTLGGNEAHPTKAYLVSWMPRILSWRNSGSRNP